MRRRCAWLYEALVRLPGDWLPPEDDAEAVAVGGVLRLPRHRLRVDGERLHDAFGYVGFLLAEVEIQRLGACWECGEFGFPFERRGKWRNSVAFPLEINGKGGGKGVLGPGMS